MNEKKIKAVAAKLLKVGVTKVYVNPNEGERLKEAMTKDDIRALIKDKVISKRRMNEHSRAHARMLALKRKKGRKRGKGKRTGTRNARSGKKDKWIKNVRAQRRTLKELKESGAKLSTAPRQVYLMIKGGYFKGKKYLQAYAQEEKKK